MAKRFDQYCPIAHALSLVGERWALLVVRELLKGPKRYTDLVAGLPGIGTNILATRLRELEAAGVLHKRKLPPPAASTVYELTPYGAGLEEVIHAIARWGTRSLGVPRHEDDIDREWGLNAFPALFYPERARGLTETYVIRVDDDAFTVHLVDGREVEADVIICATGYAMKFPFSDDAETDLHPDEDHRYPLFKRMIKPGVDHLFFLGLAQSSPTIVNLAEQQSKLLAKLLTGSYALPSVSEQERIMVADEQAHLEQYYDAPRHTIQIDFARYTVDLWEEIAAGEARARGTESRTG